MGLGSTKYVPRGVDLVKRREKVRNCCHSDNGKTEIGCVSVFRKGPLSVFRRCCIYRGNAANVGVLHCDWLSLPTTGESFDVLL